ncbi:MULTISPECIES: nitric oxide synthase oxygenase [unclassified Micromonospora]|uniref:nitric oxide synthase oxygenase n=1 Tax=unclassified Micromonospora TaxID=2617518 RepID=UPI001C24AD3F|nr:MULTISPECIES: nitric oxide synthase oxygenase [unclassified Micromonospora]MBU8857804.1 nitric oxide synthase oxygenase [Micromonospora sp. WMMB482]MDM4783435.1 nitric oxide synthase oxygenase [Micromonospora sp. b486]
MTTSPAADEALHRQAHQFLRQYHDETSAPEFATRWRRVRAEVADTGTWQPTLDELTYAARVAWRNAGRCIGRARWSSLTVRDRRDTITVLALRQELTGHLDETTANGRVRSVLTVLAPATATAPAPLRIINPQLARYAAWHTDGGVVGDPANLPLTALAVRLGWTGPTHRGAFDLLPWIAATADGRLHLLHPDHTRIRQVPIHHPHHPWLADLALRWPAVPVISNMTLHLGGLQFPAPFSGAFMASEIAARNLADPDRYHQLPAVIDGLGLPDHDRLRADKALLTLHEAVLHSYENARVSITDHHRESRAFARFTAREEAAGRTVTGDWSWLNSYPMTPQDPSWPRYYDTSQPTPALRPNPHTLTTG